MFDAIRQEIADIPQGQTENKALLFNRLCRGIDNAGERGQKEKAMGGLLSDYSPDSLVLYRQAVRNWQEFLASQPDILTFHMKVTSPMVVGKGDQNVHEFGITLQMPWGTPVIPGFAIKGVLSSFAHAQGGADWQKGVLSSFAGQFSLIMFGGQSGEKKKSFAGALDFLDAWWLPGPGATPFTEDIINAHNQTWYQEAGDNHAPGNWPDGMDSPIPIPFAVVKPGEVFLFAIRGAGSWRELAKEMLKKAAADHGFGAKTRVGYGRLGYFETIEDVIASLPGKSDAELARLFQKHGNDEAFQTNFQREADTRTCVPDLFPLFQKYRPDQVVLAQLTLCQDWGALKQLIQQKTDDSWLEREEFANTLSEVAKSLRETAGKTWKEERDKEIAQWLTPAAIDWSPPSAVSPQGGTQPSLTEEENRLVLQINTMEWGEQIKTVASNPVALSLPVALVLQTRLKALGCDNKKAKDQEKPKAFKVVTAHINKIKKEQ